MGALFCESSKFLLFVICTNQIFSIAAEKIFKHEKFEVVSTDKEYYSVLKVDITGTEKPTINMECNLIQDLVNPIFSTNMFKFNDGKYEPTVLNLETVSTCELIDNEMVYEMRKAMSDGVHGNLPVKCTDGNKILKNNYFVKDFVLDNLPDLAISGRWKNEMKYYQGDKVIAEFHWYGEILDRD